MPEINIKSPGNFYCYIFVQGLNSISGGRNPTELIVLMISSILEKAGIQTGCPNEQLVVQSITASIQTQLQQDLVAILDEQGRYRYASAAYSDQFGYNSSDLMGEDAFDMVHPEDLAALQKEFQRLLKTKQERSASYRFMRKDGSFAWLKSNASYLPDSAPVSGYLIRSMDVTDLIQPKEDLNQIFETAQDIIGICGLDGFIKRINPAACKLMGYTEQELLSIPFMELIYEEDRTATVQRLLELSVVKGCTSLESRLVTKSGNIVWLNWSFSLSKDEPVIFAVAKDITEKRNLQELLNNAGSLAGIGAWEYNLSESCFALSTVAREVLQISNQNQVAKDTILQLFGCEKNKTKIKSLIVQTCRSGKKFDEEFLIRTGVDSCKWVRIIGEREQNCPFGHRIVGSIQDIHVRKMNEAALLQLNKDLERKAKELAASNTELEQFAYVASHDLQEPLRMVTSFLTRIEKKYEPLLDEKGKQYIHYAVDGSMRMRQIILDLLNYSRIGRNSQMKQRIDLNEVVKEIGALYAASIEEKEAVLTCEDLPVILWYHSPLLQLFQNLIDNALKYARPGVASQISIKANDEGEHWQLTIADNGIGIEPAYFDRIFNMFQRLHQHATYEGTGMGLAIAKKIVEKWDGTIWVESVYGAGTSFHFTLPKQLLHEA